MTEPLTPERLAEIRNRRLDEVTAGPWLVSDDQYGCPVIYAEQTTPEGTVYGSVLLTAAWASEADVQFVCSARESVPQLLAEVDRLRAEVDRLRREIERPAVEAKRREIRDVLNTSMAEAREDREFEGEAELGLKLRKYEAKWSAEDAGRAER